VGLLTDVQPPDLETRIAILRKKASRNGCRFRTTCWSSSEPKISTNIRELEGALIRVTAFANLNRQPVDLRLAEIVLRDLMPDDASRQITPATIMAQTAAYFGLTIDDLRASPAHGCWSPPARSPCTCAASSPTCPCPKIGQQFGGRDHTTVMHADKKIRQLMAERRAIYNQVTELTNRIKQTPGRARAGPISSTAVLKPVENPFSCTPLPPQFMLSHAGLSTTPVENLGCRWTSHPLDVDDARRRRGRPVNEPWVSTGPPTVVHSSSTTGPHPGSPR
jgi:hypothetical protein